MNITSFNNLSFNAKPFHEFIFTLNDFFISDKESLLSHKVKLFKKNPIIINSEINIYKKLLNNFKFLKNLNYEYQSIDWLTDFYSNYTYQKNVIYCNVSLNFNKNTDIKVPWELSRFQHFNCFKSRNDSILCNEFIFQVCDWIYINKYCYGVNWRSSMDVGMRAISWIFFFSNNISFFSKKNEFYDLFTKSLYQHFYHVLYNLDYWGKSIKRGNHYATQLASLLIILIFLNDKKLLKKYYNKIETLFLTEFDYQFNKDNVNKESSSSYHRLVLEVFLYTASILEFNFKNNHG